MGITPTKNMLITLAIIPFTNFLPISGQPFQSQSPVSSHSVSFPEFKPNFIIVNGRVEQISSELTSEVEAINSLMTIGNILFKDSRHETNNELKAIRSYYKSKYKKV
jgi:hypothetical protein